MNKIGTHQRHLFDNGMTKITLGEHSDVVVLKTKEDIYENLINDYSNGNTILTNYINNDSVPHLIGYIDMIKEMMKEGKIIITIRDGNAILENTLEEIIEDSYESGYADYDDLEIGEIGYCDKDFYRMFERQRKHKRIYSRNERKKSFEKKFTELYKKRIDNLHEVLYTVYKTRVRKY